MNGSLLYGDSLTPADLGPAVPGGAYTVAVGQYAACPGITITMGAEARVLQSVNEVLQALVAGTVPDEARERLARVLAVTAPVSIVIQGCPALPAAPAHNPFRAHDTSVYGGIR